MRAFLSLFSLAAISVSAVPAHAAERRFDVGGFAEIAVLGSPDVEVRTGLKPSVVAVGDQQDLDRLDIRVEGERLVIGTKPGSWRWMSRESPRLQVTVPMLRAATLSGSGDIRIDRLEGPFAGRISGSGDMNLGSINAPTLSLAISGSGDMAVAGRCGAGTLSISGSGDIDAGGLTCRTVDAQVTGSGDIAVRATETGNLRVTGSGDIDVTGGARCTSRTTGSGTINCR